MAQLYIPCNLTCFKKLRSFWSTCTLFDSNVSSSLLFKLSFNFSVAISDFISVPPCAFDNSINCTIIL